MIIFDSEAELLAALEIGARQIEDCVQGRITFDNFLYRYDDFYDRYALDGHESDDEEIALFQKYSGEISLHKEIRDEINYKTTFDEFITRPEVIQAGFIGHDEGMRRLRILAQKYKCQLDLDMD